MIKNTKRKLETLLIIVAECKDVSNVRKFDPDSSTQTRLAWVHGTPPHFRVPKLRLNFILSTQQQIEYLDPQTTHIIRKGHCDQYPLFL